MGKVKLNSSYDVKRTVADCNGSLFSMTCYVCIIIDNNYDVIIPYTHNTAHVISTTP